MNALRVRNFWPYFAGNLCSNCGTWFQNIAQALLVYRLSHSTFLVGVVNFAQFVGVFLLAPWAGAAADRFDRRRLIVVTQIIAAGVTAGLAALQGAGRATTPVVIGLVLVVGLTWAFAVPAIQAMVPDLVPTGLVPSALAMSSLTFNLSRAIGPVLGAAVVSQWGIGVAFGMNALSYLGLIAGLLAVQPRQAPRRSGPGLGWSDSLRLVGKDPALLALLMVVAAISISQDPVSTLTPGFSSEVFGRSDTVTGLLVGAFGAGAALAAAPAATPARDPGRRLAPGAVLMGVGMLGFALAPALPFAFGALVVGGFFFMLTNTCATTALTLEVAPEQRGRVMALWSLCFLGTRPPASLVDGALASTAGLRAAAVALTVPVLAAGALMAVLRRRVPRLHEVGICPAVMAEAPAPAAFLPGRSGGTQ